MTTELGLTLKPDMKIKVKVVNPSTGRFCINLCDPDGTIVLHVNPRFTVGGNNTLVLNTLEHGKWGHEERPTGFDFHHGIKATVEIEVKKHGYKISSNGRFVHKYAHRVPLDRVVKVVFHKQESDVKLRSINVHYDDL